MTTAPSPVRRSWIPPLLVVVMTVAVFLPALQGQFLNWDDDTNFLSNPHYRGLAPANLRWMFTDFTYLYIPFTWLTLGLDYVLWGMNPVGYHATSLVLHGMNALLFFLVLRELLRRARPDGEAPLRDWIAAAGAGFFSLHPLRVESVAWITERRDLTSGAFFLLTLLNYLRWTETRRPVWLCSSIGCFAGMILSKPMGMTLPLVLLVIDAFPLRRFSTEKLRPLLLEKVPYFALMVVAVLLTGIGLRRGEALDTGQTYSLVHSLAQPGYRISFYALKTLVPWQLSPLYWFRPAIGFPQLLGWLAVLSVTAAVLVRRQTWPAATASWIAYGLLIAPVSGVFQAGAHFAADRYSYLACLPFAALAAALLLRISETPFARPAAAIAGAILAGLALLSTNQCLIWRNSIVLWNHALRLDPELYLAYNNRGTARAAAGDWDGAVGDYNRSISINPEWPKPWYNRGVARATRGDHAGAIEDFSRAVLLDPKHKDAIASRAISHSKRGEISEALADCEEVIRISPGSAIGYATRGMVRFSRGDGPGAVADYTRALDIAPSPEVYRNRAQARVQMKRFSEALADYTRSLELRPSHDETLRGRAIARSMAGDIPGALNDLDDALRLQPGPSLYLSRAAVRGMGGDIDGAIADCTEAIRLQPEDAEAYLRRGMARRERKDGAGAIQDLENALRFAAPGWPQRPQTEDLLRRLRTR
jgi:tetratricopeptide (TPR) repeat protein